MSQPFESQAERRSFLTRLKGGAAAAAALALGGRALAQTKTPRVFEATRHEQDQWMDELPGKHRIVFDTIHNDGIGNALMFANNYLVANRTGYGLQNSDLAVLIILRHLSTGMGFNDAVWAKYGTTIASMSNIAPAPKSNPRFAGAMGIEALARQGVHFGVCAMASSRVAGSIAQANGLTTEAVMAEFAANLVPNAHMVPAGIVAVSRAQERGYTLVSS